MKYVRFNDKTKQVLVNLNTESLVIYVLTRFADRYGYEVVYEVK